MITVFIAYFCARSLSESAFSFCECVCVWAHYFLWHPALAAAYYYWKVRLIKMHIKCGNGYDPNYNFSRVELLAVQE